MSEHVCPVWVGHLLASPLRRWLHDPDKILGPHVMEGMTALDIGCAMGFFSLPLAEMVGACGKVISVDMQENMLKSLEIRAKRAGLSERMQLRACSQDSLGIDDMGGAVDFALAFAVIHEVSNQEHLFSELNQAIRTGGKLLLAEPKGHVPKKEFEATIALAVDEGFDVTCHLPVRICRAVLMEKRSAENERV